MGLKLAASPQRGSSEAGLVVRGIAPGSSAERAGVLPGDRLTHIDKNAVVDMIEVRRILRALRPNDPLLLKVLRAGAPLTLETEVLPYPLEQHPGARTILDQVKVEDHWLRALCVLPERPGPHPVVYYLPGAHWASEEYPLEPEHPVPALATAFAAAGVAMLRVERSGLGDSQGPPCARVDFEAELEGFRAGLSFLQQASWADSQRLFLFGHSVGAMVAPLLALEAEPAGIITFGASAIPISAGLIGALERYAEIQTDTPKAEARKRAQQISELIRLVVSGKKTPQEVFRSRPDLQRIAPSHFSGDQAYGRIVTFYHQLERQDLERAWRGVRCKVLFLHGERDWISTSADSVHLSEMVGEKASCMEVQGADHQLSDAPAREKPRLAGSLKKAILERLLRQLSEA